MTARRVYLIRHAKAEGHHAQGDAARRLLPEGRARFNRGLAELGERLAVKRIVTSPFVRARQTAELLAGATGAPVEEEPGLASGAASARDVLSLVRAAGTGTALVGHNPEFAEVICDAAGRELEVKPGAVAALDVDGRKVTLAWLERGSKG
ncbi:MAG: histidine phosphatase family protein [Anaeromyxobacter sp.]